MYLQNRIVKGSLKPFLSLSFQEELADMVSTLLPDRTSWYPLNESLRIRASLSDWKVQIAVCYAQMHSILLAHTWSFHTMLGRDIGALKPMFTSRQTKCILWLCRQCAATKHRCDRSSTLQGKWCSCLSAIPRKIVYNMEKMETCKPMILRLTIDFADRALTRGTSWAFDWWYLYRLCTRCFFHRFRFFGRPQESKKCREEYAPSALVFLLNVAFLVCRMALDVVSVTSSRAFQEVIREIFASPAASW